MNTLKWVVALRHCEDLSDDDLTDRGIVQSHVLAETLKKKLPPGERVFVCSSPPGRAVKTAEHIAQQFKTSVQIIGVLERDSFRDGVAQREAIERIVDKHTIVVAVTHYEAPAGIIASFSMKYLRKNYYGEITEKGRGLLLNCSTGEVYDIP